jgi:hypothetical protein
MSTIVVKTNSKEKFNQLCLYPFVGDQKTNEKGEFEIDESRRSDVVKLIKAQPDFFILGEELNVGEVDELRDDQKDGNESLEKVDTATLGGESGESTPAVLSKEEKEAFIASLPDKSRKELEELCKDFPGSEWRGKNKADMATYLIGKLGE